MDLENLLCKNCGAAIEKVESNPALKAEVASVAMGEVAKVENSPQFRHVSKAIHCDLDDPASLVAEPK